MSDRTCQECNHSFVSGLSMCPKCGSKNTKTRIEIQKRKAAKVTALLGKKTCPKCELYMKRGFLVEAKFRVHPIKVKYPPKEVA